MHLVDIAYGLAGLIGVGIIFIGARFLLAPEVAAMGFGVAIGTESRGAGAYLTAKGVRDIASGFFVFILIANGAPHVLGWMIVAATLIPLGDALTVLGHDGPKPTAYGAHGGTAALMLATAGLLFVVPG
jgi:hypothetical protein